MGGATGQILYISLGDLRPLVGAAQAAGVSPSDVFARVGWRRDLLDAPDTTPIELSDYFRFWEEALHEAQDETMGVSRRPLMPGTTHFVLSHLIGKNTLFDAMKEIAMAYNVMHGGNYNHVELSRHRLCYVIDDRKFPYTSSANPHFLYFAMECVLIFLHSILVLVSSEAVYANLMKLHVRRERELYRGSHLSFWNAPIRYNSQSYALIYHPSLAELPISITAETLPPQQMVFKKIAELIESRQANFVTRPCIKDQVLRLLQQGAVSQAVVATKLGFSTASLRRRLEEKGTSFRALCLIAQNNQAKSLLRQGFSIHEVAERLGFSDFRSFTRAFKKWNGQTPATFLLSK